MQIDIAIRYNYIQIGQLLERIKNNFKISFITTENIKYISIFFKLRLFLIKLNVSMIQ